MGVSPYFFLLGIVMSFLVVLPIKGFQGAEPMNCNLCGKPVLLFPSAAERARTDVTDKTAAYYTSLFPTHAACILRKRHEKN